MTSAEHFNCYILYWSVVNTRRLICLAFTIFRLAGSVPQLQNATRTTVTNTPLEELFCVDVE